MTQGNCGRMAVGTRPDSAARGPTRPPPPPRHCSTPPPDSAPASPRSPHFLRSPPPVPSGGTASPRTRRREGRRSVAERGGGGGGEDREGREVRGVGRGTPAGSAGCAPPRPRPSPPPGRPGPPPALAGSFVLFPPTNYLSEQRAGGRPKEGASLPEGLLASVRRALWGARGGSVRVSRPPALLSSLFPLLFCCLHSRTRHSLGCFSPSHLGVCGVDVQRAQ